MGNIPTLFAMGMERRAHRRGEGRQPHRVRHEVIIAGRLSNGIGRRGLIVAGMWMQDAAIFVTAASSNFRGGVFQHFIRVRAALTQIAVT